MDVARLLAPNLVNCAPFAFDVFLGRAWRLCQRRENLSDLIGYERENHELFYLIQEFDTAPI